MEDSSENKKVVIKLGTNVLTDSNGNIDMAVIKNTCAQVAQLKSLGYSVILVSSGAVGAGKSILKLKNEIDDAVRRRQLYSSIGQVKLMNLYADEFSKYNLFVAQVLATKEEFKGLEQYKNMKNCFMGLLDSDIIPIVNENDVVSLDELMFTDNDELAGLTSFLIEAQQLLILTNVNGLYTGHPDNESSELISVVKRGDDVEKFISSEKSTGGRGGMQSKFDTATRCAEKGIEVLIANGKKENIIIDMLINNGEGTRFLVDE